MTLSISFPEPITARQFERFMQRFSEDAGEAIAGAVKSLLGTSSIYSLSPGYAEIKPRLKGFKRVSGKASDQPLIFSGEMYEGVEWKLDGNVLEVGVKNGAGMNAGFDYADRWEQKTDFLEKGYNLLGDSKVLSIFDVCWDEVIGDAA